MGRKVYKSIIGADQMRKEKLIELIKYGFWGGISTAINLALFYMFIFFKMQYVCSNIVSYIIAVTFSYIFNDIFVFKNNTSKATEKGIKYFIMRAVSVGIDSGILVFLHKVCGIDIAISKIIDSIIIIGGTYVVSKVFIFKKD